MTPTGSALLRLSATQLSAAIAAAEVSCVELMTATLDQIEALNPTYNAVVSLRARAELLAEAADRDREIRLGEWRGWLHGIPFAAKDLTDVAGLPSTLGLFRPEEVGPAPDDSWPMARVRAAGTVFLGKTNTPQLGLGSHTFNDVFGATGNPFDPRWSAGGSSGGAAAAVSLRLVPVADGSDFMGSLRNPAGWCQVYGLRPTPGVISDADDSPFELAGAVVGPMARRADDLTALFGTLAGTDLPIPRRLPQAPRLGWLGDLDGYLPMSRGLLGSVARALAPVSELHGSLRPASLDGPGFLVERDLWPTWLTFRHWQVGGGLEPLYADPAIRERLRPEARFEVEGLFGLNGHPTIGPRELIACAAARRELLHRFQALFADFDLLLAPTSQVFPFPLEDRWPQDIEGVPMTTYHRWMEVTAPATLVGLPVLGLPLGLDGQGRPFGAQVIAPPHEEGRLLDFARRWESTFGPPPAPPAPPGPTGSSDHG
jgi:amidase